MAYKRPRKLNKKKLNGAAHSTLKDNRPLRHPRGGIKK